MVYAVTLPLAGIQVHFWSLSGFTFQFWLTQEKCAREFFVLARILAMPNARRLSRHFHHRTLAQKFFWVFVECDLAAA